jgi:hypothetical protein
MRFNQLLVIAMITIFLISCSDSSQAIDAEIENKFQELYPTISMNKHFQIQVNDDNETFRSTSEIRLIFYNDSANTISFATDSFMHLFIIRDNEWVEVENAITYKGLLQIDPKDTPLMDFGTTRVKPILGDNWVSGKRELLRIVMVGELTGNDSIEGEYAGAYLDIELSP